MKLSVQEMTLLNRGTNSQIYRYGSEGKSVALKVVPVKFKKQCRHLVNQYQILSYLKHEKIIKALKYKSNVHLQGMGSSYHQEDKKNIANVIVFENATHGSLLQFWKKCQLSVGQSRWIFAELCQAVRHLHRNYIVHRDLKLDNVMVFQNESQIFVKLGDFGFATNTKQSCTSNSYKGTERGYMAPEIHNLLTNPTSSYDMYKSDIFALGVILFSLVTKRMPFLSSASNDPHYKLLQTGKIEQFWLLHQKSFKNPQVQQDSLYKEFKQAFIRMVDPDPKKRPQIDQVFKFSWMMGRQQLILPQKASQHKEFPKNS